MSTRQRPNRSFQKGALLEISMTENDLLIMGNRKGLSSLASLIMYVATAQPTRNDNPDLYHEHVGFSWYHELNKKLIVHVGRIPLTPPTKTMAGKGKGKDVTIMLTKKIGKSFWKGEIKKFKKG